MTKFGKCLVVFAVGASFAFLGFAWVSMMGGPNWQAEASLLPDYTIQKDDGKWSVRDRVTGETIPVKAPTVQASAIVAARAAMQKKHDAEIKRLRDETAKYKKDSAEVRQLNEMDLKALDARARELDRQLTSLNARILSLSKDQVTKSQEAQAIRIEAAKRREDVFRLTRELQEIRADQFRADELAQKLNGQLVRLRGVVAALESRNEQLQKQVRDAANIRDSGPAH